MSSALPFTGERFTPECAGGIWYEHWHRYVMVRNWARDKVVLDAACGEGYGSAFLASAATRVIGVDLSSDAVSHARAKYGSRANLEYQRASVTSLPIADASVDMIVSFETIEHLPDQEAMLAEFRRALRPEGILVLSAPNRPVYSDEQNYRNEFHVREHDRAELSSLLAKQFSKTRWYGQRLQFNSALWTLDCPAGHFGPAQSIAMDAKALEPAGGMPEPMYFVVICAGDAAVLPDAESLSLFADSHQSVLKQYEDLMAWQWEARDQIAQLEGQVTRLRQVAEEQLAGREKALHVNREALAALEETVQRLTASHDAADSGLAALRAELHSLQMQFDYRNSLIGWIRWPFHRIRKLWS